MATTVNEVLNVIDGIAPFCTAVEYDNTGLLVGSSSRTVRKVLVALDVTSAVIDEAVAAEAQLIVCHHPIIFSSIKSVTDNAYATTLIMKCLQNGLSVIAAHTNFDKALGGNNDLLASAFGGVNITEWDNGLARKFDLPKSTSLKDLSALAGKILNDNNIRTINSGQISRAIVSSGSGASEDLILEAKKSDSALITADIKHHLAVMAYDLGVKVIEIGHYTSEWCFVDLMCKRLAGMIKNIEIVASKRNVNPYNN